MGGNRKRIEGKKKIRQNAILNLSVNKVSRFFRSQFLGVLKKHPQHPLTENRSSRPFLVIFTEMKKSNEASFDFDNENK